MAKESWAQTGRAPLTTPRFAFDAAGKQAKDVHSNSLGGITQRTATDTAVRRGWLLPEDARDQMRRVCTAAARFGGGACTPYAPPAFATTG